jgi:hypothetical protein
MAAGGAEATAAITPTRFIFQSGEVVGIDGLAKIEEKLGEKRPTYDCKSLNPACWN